MPPDSDYEPFVYFAGKVARDEDDYKGFEWQWPWRSQIIGTDFEPPPLNGFRYSGPEILDLGGHGYALESHPGEPANRKIVAEDLAAITRSDVVFVWLDSFDAYGTLSEIGYASGLGIPIFIAVHDYLAELPAFKELWFVLMMASQVDVVITVTDGWEAFCVWWARSGYNLIHENRRLRAELTEWQGGFNAT